ncbi:MAG: class I SAM-dependent methyltransferase [Gammaproteobacteria bacterium]|nr:class I SAM-dependent methyltransferase [Gammaproteobacteria bacterium]
MTSYTSLANKLNLPKDLPITPDWSAAADFLQLIVDHSLNTQPVTILECSSGLTSLMLSRCCQINQQGQVYSLENGKEYALKTQAHLDHHQLAQYATIIHAPLEAYVIGERNYSWYRINEIPQQAIDMLVIDGPPGFIQKHSRYPALPLLWNKLADHCTIFLDDAAREEEQELVTMWLQEYPDLKHEYIDTERGCSILIINK